jgi:hypothetical protein
MSWIKARAQERTAPELEVSEQESHIVTGRDKQTQTA